MNRDIEQATAAARAQFGRQATAYTRSKTHAEGADLRRMLELLALQGQETALDIATGTGHTALALAPHCREVTGLDPTPEMLGEAARLAAARGIKNVRWVRAAAEDLPFADQCFDVVTVRRAPHHFQSIPRALVEVHRVLRPGGSLLVIDQIVPENQAGAAFLEALERKRDPSHIRALPVSEWRVALEQAGFQVRHMEVDEEVRPFSEYLDVAGAAGEERAAILAMVIGASADERSAIGWSEEPAPEGSFLKQRVIAYAVRISVG